MPIVRSVLAVFLGLVSGFFLILAVQKLGQAIYPEPPGMDRSKPETMTAIAPGMFGFVLLAWGLGTFIGSGIAARVAPTGKRWFGLLIGGLFLASSLSQMRMFPHPVWFQVIGVIEFLPLAYLGARLVTSNPDRPGPPTDPDGEGPLSK